MVGVLAVLMIAAVLLLPSKAPLIVVVGTNDTGVVRCNGSLVPRGDDDGELSLQLAGTRVTGGWQLSGVFQRQSGQPIGWGNIIVNGVVSGPGEITKIGARTLYLLNTNDYTGGTTVGGHQGLEVLASCVITPPKAGGGGGSGDDAS